MKNIIAIDPGADGGIAWYDLDGNPNCVPMPETEGDLCELLARHPMTVAFLEEVGGYCGVAQPGSAAFKFGRNFGFVLGCLMSMGRRVELVRPQKWQKHFGLGTVRDSGGKSEWKRKLKAEAQRRFPTCSVTLKTADALLILDYGRSHLL